MLTGWQFSIKQIVCILDLSSICATKNFVLHTMYSLCCCCCNILFLWERTISCLSFYLLEFPSAHSHFLSTCSHLLTQQIFCSSTESAAFDDLPTDLVNSLVGKHSDNMTRKSLIHRKLEALILQVYNARKQTRHIDDHIPKMKLSTISNSVIVYSYYLVINRQHDCRPFLFISFSSVLYHHFVPAVILCHQAVSSEVYQPLSSSWSTVNFSRRPVCYDLVQPHVQSSATSNSLQDVDELCFLWFSLKGSFL